MKRALVIAIALLSMPGLARGFEENWSRFRGPGVLGTIENANLPETWSTTENVAWKTAIAGYGWSSPVIWEDKIFVTTVVSDGTEEKHKKGLYLDGDRMDASTDTHHWKVCCLALADGRVLWEREVRSGPPPKARHLKNTYASETPVVDGKRVYAHFGNVGVFALDLDGELLWERPLPAYDTLHGWGTGSSPVLYEDRLFIVHDNEERSYMVALDTTTGEVVWMIDREASSAWSTPFVWENEIRTEIITNGGDSPSIVARLGFRIATGNKIRSYDLEGNLLWEMAGGAEPVVTSPFAWDGLLYVMSGWVAHPYRPTFAIRPGASGDISLKEGETTNEHIVWSSDKLGPYHPTPIIVEGLYYSLHDRGFMLCNDAKTGEVVYGRQRIKSTAGFSASPWSYDGKIFCLNEDGDTHVIKAGREFEILGVNRLDAMCMATPAMTRDRLIIRTASNVYCIRKP